MLNSNFKMRVLKNNETNLKILMAIGNQEVSKEYHILRNRLKLVLISHPVWEKCEYCNLDIRDDGIIDMA